MIDRRWRMRFVAMPLALLVLSLVGCAKSPGRRAGATSDAAVGGATDSGAAGAGSVETGGRQSGQGLDGNDDNADGGRGAARGGAQGWAGRGSGAGGGAGAEDSRAAAMIAAARPSPAQFSEAPTFGDIHFDFDRYEIRSDDVRTLDAHAEWLRANPNASILIEGHCDERGTNEYNLALGDHRAKSAMNYLVGQGVTANRITVISYGEERPVCQERSEECWAQNRRSHFLVKTR